MKILVVDDHALVRQGLRHTLKQLDAAAIVLEAQDSAGALSAADAHSDLDLVLLDVGLPGSDGFFALSHLRRRHPTIPVVMVSANDERKNITQAIERGAIGFISKAATTVQMLNALKQVLAGGIYFPPEFSPRARSAVANRAHLPRPAAKLALTERQTEVLRLLADGESNKAIGHRLGMSESTVKTHVTHIFKALQVTSRAQAMALLQQRNTYPSA